jgi:ketosteroid isomerase-like protein
MALVGKGFFTWQIPHCEGGNAAKIAARAAQAGLTHVLLKIADGPFPYNLDSKGNDLLPPVVSELRARGISPWGWHYIYGNNPTGEAKIAVNRTLQLGLDGYVIDAEMEFERKGMATPAGTYVRQLRAGLPHLPIALSSFRYPNVHQQFPWSTFLDKCDFNMPQVYWEQAHNPQYQLQQSVAQLKALKPSLPVVPTGPAYTTSGWRPKGTELTQFLQEAEALKLTGANFFSWDWATQPAYIDLWNAVANFKWGQAPAPSDMVDRLVAAWNSHDVATVLALYQSNAAQVTAARTVVGSTAITSWYTDFLTNLLPSGKFTVTGRSGDGDSRHFTWTATSSAGQVLDGNDTLGLRANLIQYHYTYFTISPS